MVPQALDHLAPLLLTLAFLAPVCHGWRVQTSLGKVNRPLAGRRLKLERPFVSQQPNEHTPTPFSARFSMGMERGVNGLPLNRPLRTRGTSMVTRDSVSHSMGTKQATASGASAFKGLSPVELDARVVFTAGLKASWAALLSLSFSSFIKDFLGHVRQVQGDAVWFDLSNQTDFPPCYILMGKTANRYVLSGADSHLKQMLQVLFQSVLSLVDASTRVPAEEDVDLQKKVQLFFQSTHIVNKRLPSFYHTAGMMHENWIDRWQDRPAEMEGFDGDSDDAESLDVFTELSEYVVPSNLEVLYGRRFSQQHSVELNVLFRNWLRSQRDSYFFDRLGELLTDAIHDMKEKPEEYEEEDSVLKLYLNSDAFDRYETDEVVGLLVMSFMAADINTQVSLSWILVHLYSDPSLLARARDEIATCLEVKDYGTLSKLEFLNSCIDESVRLHATVPTKLVVREATQDLQVGEATIKKGSWIWLYPNAVHQDERYFEQPEKFCPMRLLNGNRKRMTDEYELVTFGIGQKRCIGEKMARALICNFLVRVLPAIDADAPAMLPADDFNDLEPAKQLRLYNIRPHKVK